MKDMPTVIEEADKLKTENVDLKKFAAQFPSTNQLRELDDVDLLEDPTGHWMRCLYHCSAGRKGDMASFHPDMLKTLHEKWGDTVPVDKLRPWRVLRAVRQHIDELREQVAHRFSRSSVQSNNMYAYDLSEMVLIGSLILPHVLKMRSSQMRKYITLAEEVCGGTHSTEWPYCSVSSQIASAIEIEITRKWNKED